MDEFRTEEEAAFRKAAADYFRRLDVPDSAGTATAVADMWRDLDGPPDAVDTPASRRERLGRRVSILEEAACHDPRLGHDLLAWRVASAPFDPPEELACRLGRLAGTASHVLDAGARAARERGYYSSSLLDFRTVQESLAGLIWGAGLARLGACRLCRLLERGENERAACETAGLDVRAMALAAEVWSVALSLLGSSWVDSRLPPEGGPSPDERTRS